ncbi:MAG: hypothetical protein CBC09_07425 [Cellvibrionales bacterium TMED49]|nr:hypothetical protein [Porticoccaceae bacterium]OUU37069.1 MAG: hypothetical protein CBC09_07425 [Cellvibrionales bacterium TMED49]|tara:strand:- start:226 stop:573 length:348 start_codon:yes stop_codon:yes gene_type:complete
MSFEQLPPLQKAFWVYGVAYLSVLYIGAFLILIAPLELALGLPRGSGFNYFRLAVIVLLCGYGTFKVIRLIVAIGQHTEPRRDDKIKPEFAIGFTVFAGIILFFSTTLWAISKTF